MTDSEKNRTVTAQISYDDAWRVIEADYWDDVRGAVEELTRGIKDGEIEDKEEFHDRLHEYVDSMQRVIYTHQARVGMACTDNPTACEDETGDKSETVEGAMFWALMADIGERCNYNDIVAELEEQAKATE